jgi:hypothetical protein
MRVHSDPHDPFTPLAGRKSQKEIVQIWQKDLRFDVTSSLPMPFWSSHSSDGAIAWNPTD